MLRTINYTPMDFYRNKNVLITGGLGFLGSTLAQALVPLGARVTLVDPLLPLYGGNLFNIEGIRDQVAVHFADIRNEEAMNQLVQGQDVIFHIGNQTSHLDSMTDPLLDVDINCRGNIVFYEACRRHNPEAVIVYAGTRGQYGRLTKLPADESAIPNPTDIYGVNKHAGEQYLFVYSQAFGLRGTSLRLTNGYGPRHQMKHGRYGILNWFIRLALDDQTIQVYGDGSQLREYVYVDDMVQAFLLAGASPTATGQAFNVSGHERYRFGDLAKLVVEVAGSGRVEHVPWPKERRDIETGDFAADWSKIRTTLGWEPKVSLNEGLERTVAYYRQHKEHYW